MYMYIHTCPGGQRGGAPAADSRPRRASGLALRAPRYDNHDTNTSNNDNDTTNDNTTNGNDTYNDDYCYYYY